MRSEDNRNDSGDTDPGAGPGEAYKELNVQRGVDFDVARGSIFALLGSKGAGKTTVVMVNGAVGLVGTYVHVGSSPSAQIATHADRQQSTFT